MLEFTHRRNLVRLKAGEAWTPPPAGDTYRDAPTGELQDIIASIRAGQPWREAIDRRYARVHPWLHRVITSEHRDRFFRECPPRPGAHVLDLGSGWGQIALPLARAGCRVVALEPTPERLAFIQAAAAQEGTAASLHFVQADFFDTEFRAEFDLVACIGVLEWVPRFRAGDPRELQIEFLRRARQALAPGGALVLGIENRVGLKYLLGARDDHIATANIAVFDAALAAEKWRLSSGQPLRSFTYSRSELEELLEAAGFSRCAFFAALPDYKVPEKILPLGPETEAFFASGGFVAEHDGCNGEPLANQDELKSHYRTFGRLGVGSAFVPSFFVRASVS